MFPIVLRLSCGVPFPQRVRNESGEAIMSTSLCSHFTSVKLMSELRLISLN
jgi:hypothetical protein